MPLALEEVVNAVRAIPGLVPQSASLRAREIGNGNMNYVFRVQDDSGNTAFRAIVKHAPPYMRSVGPDWPLTADRIRLESDALTLQYAVCSRRVPAIYHFDAARRLLVMEDLSDHLVLRDALIEHRQYPHWTRQTGLFLARMYWETSAFSRRAADIGALRRRFANTDLKRITSDFVFTYPFRVHLMNRVAPALDATVRAMWDNPSIQAEVRFLRGRFNADSNALVHGDLHTGSIMVDDQDTKIIDPEFACYGPIGFDVGVLTAHLLLQWCARVAETSELPGAAPDADILFDHAEAIWKTFCGALRHWWPQRLPGSDEGRSLEEHCDMLFRAALAYAGCEIIRRVVGTSHVADVERIADPIAKARAEGLALELGQTLILDHSRFSDFSEVLAQIRLDGA